MIDFDKRLLATMIPYVKLQPSYGMYDNVPRSLRVYIVEGKEGFWSNTPWEVHQRKYDEIVDIDETVEVRIDDRNGGTLCKVRSEVFEKIANQANLVKAQV